MLDAFVVGTAITIAIIALFSIRKNKISSKSRILTSYYVEDTPSKQECEVICELIDERTKEYSELLSVIRKLKKVHWIDSRIVEFLPKVSEITDKRQKFIEMNLDAEIGDSFYKKSLKSVFSKKIKNELKLEGDAVCKRLINITQYKTDIHKLIHECNGQILNEMREIVLKCSKKAPFDSPRSIFYLEKIQNNPERWKKMVGVNDEFRELLTPNKDPFIHIGIYSTIFGLEMLYWMEEYGAETTLDLSMHIFIPHIPDLADGATEMIRNWIVEEFGEAALTEVLQMVAELVMFIGIFTWTWRIIRYGMKAKKIFIDKEPLQKIRKSIKESLSNTIVTLKDQGEQALNQAIRQQYNLQIESLTKIEGPLINWLDQAAIRRKELQRYL